MIIAGGSFGRSGRAVLDERQALVLHGASEATYPVRRITELAASRKYLDLPGCLAYLVGIPAVTVLGFLAFGVLGTLAGLAVAVFGVYVSVRERLVRVSFDDGRRVDLVCSPRDARRLVELHRKAADGGIDRDR